MRAGNPSPRSLRPRPCFPDATFPPPCQRPCCSLWSSVFPLFLCLPLPPFSPTKTLPSAEWRKLFVVTRALAWRPWSRERDRLRMSPPGPAGGQTRSQAFGSRLGDFVPDGVTNMIVPLFVLISDPVPPWCFHITFRPGALRTPPPLNALVHRPGIPFVF